MNRLSRFIPAVAGAVAGGAIALIVASGGTTKSTTTTVVEPSRGAALPTSLSSGKGLTVNQIYKSASPGVVDILVTSTTGQSVFGTTQQTQGEGAGVVYDKQGNIVTDQHVVAGATNVTVKFQDGRKASATVLATDPQTDLAVIHVNVPASELHPIALADSSQAQVGDPVVAIGSPFSLPETTTAGIVSQTGRSIGAPSGFTIPGAIQTDAPINPGNSGGPLLDASGHVLGLNDQIDTNNQTASGQGSSSGVGFAIPSNTVQRIANEIIGGKTVQHAYLGVSLASGSGGGAEVSTHADQNGSPPIAPGGPAAIAGLKPGDLITAIDGKPVTSTDQLIATIDTYAPGNTVTLTVKRGGSTVPVKVKLGIRPAQAPGATQIP